MMTQQYNSLRSKTLQSATSIPSVLGEGLTFGMQQRGNSSFILKENRELYFYF